MPQEFTLKSLRGLIGKQQQEIAKSMKVSNSYLCQFEGHEDDHRLSSLRAYIEALGGELEIYAKFGEGRQESKYKLSGV